LKQQDVPTHHGIEGFLEGHLGRVAFAKPNVADRSPFGSSSGRLNRGRRSVNADYHPFVAD
jgi:hypothetical protein